MSVAERTSEAPRAAGATWGRDLLASIVVFLVALPLCMGVAIASGVPPALGLLSGIIGGIVVGSLAGAPLQVSGPAAGLTVIVWEIVQEHGLPGMAIIVMLAGLMQIAAGLLRVGGWFRAVSPAVIHGMLGGIGCLIMASQIHVVMDSGPKGGGIANLMALPETITKAVLPVDGSTHHLAAGIGILTVLTMMAWSRFAPMRFKLVPAPLLAVAGAMLASWALGLDIRHVTVPANLADVIRWPGMQDLALLRNGQIWTEALAVAVIASAETLLCATAVDKLHDGPRTRYDREMLAQGVGNTLCGLVGAIPVTGVIVRSSANVEAGGRTRLSAILHGVWILAFVVLLSSVLERIPVASLAAILVFTGFKLLNPKAIKELAAYGRSEVAVYVATVVAIIATNLLEGVLIGIGLALVKLLWTFSRLEVGVEPGEVADDQVLRLAGIATFLRLPVLARALEGIRPGSQLKVEFTALEYIDPACLDLMRDWAQRHQAMGGRVDVSWDSLSERYHAQRSTLQRRGA
ncbi:MAG: SulP family inorganic anion transporter [Candidatus Sericytochromatia bacterium]|nr:SulP family inorganic anion transporter [Candidatus Sericytochromatia bacterium]